MPEKSRLFCLCRYCDTCCRTESNSWIWPCAEKKFPYPASEQAWRFLVLLAQDWTATIHCRDFFLFEQRGFKFKLKTILMCCQPLFLIIRGYMPFILMYSTPLRRVFSYAYKVLRLAQISSHKCYTRSSSRAHVTFDVRSKFSSVEISSRIQYTQTDDPRNVQLYVF